VNEASALTGDPAAYESIVRRVSAGWHEVGLRVNGRPLTVPYSFSLI
jgi:hypothetical protein